MTAGAEFDPEPWWGRDADAFEAADVPREWRRRASDGAAYLVVADWAADLLRCSPAGSETEVLARAAADPEFRDAALFVMHAELDAGRGGALDAFVDAHFPSWRKRAHAEGRRALGGAVPPWPYGK